MVFLYKKLFDPKKGGWILAYLLISYIMEYRLIVREKTIRRRNPVPLPKLHKKVSVVSRYVSGNEKVNEEIGVFFGKTERFMLLKKETKTGDFYTITYLKNDLINGIYIYKYLE